jgi:hypothetical protein
LMGNRPIKTHEDKDFEDNNRMVIWNGGGHHPYALENGELFPHYP